MTEGFHMGTSRIYEIACLPKGWSYRHGLRYPLHICKENGDWIEFENYNDHHEFISKLFHPNYNVRQHKNLN